MRRIALAALACLTVVHSANAGIRLLRDGRGARVRVTVDSAGAWNAGGKVDTGTLNPLGTLRGDAPPSLSVSGAQTLAAWKDADARDISLAIGESSWIGLPSVVDSWPAETPLAVAVGGGWLIGWTSASNGGLYLCAVGTNGTLGTPERIGDGRIAGLAVTSSALNVFWVSSTGLLNATSLPPIDQLPPIYRVVRVSVLGEAPVEPLIRPAGMGAGHSIKLPHDSPPVFRTGDSTTLLDPAWQGTVATGTASVALGGSLVAVVNVSEDKAVALWWHDAHALEFVVLTNGDVGEVRQVTGRREFDPSLVREALRLVE